VALVLRALGLGDLLTAVPALRGVRRALPAHRLVLATPRGLEPLLRLASCVDEVLDVDAVRSLPAVLPWRGEPPDVAVNLHGRGPQSHELLRGLRPRRLVSFGVDGLVDGPPWCDDEHEVRRWCRLVSVGLGAACDPGDLTLARPALPSRAPGAVVVHPGAAYPSRRWPAERFAEVARTLADGGHDVVVTGSPGERALAVRVAETAGLAPSAVLAGETDLLALAALVADARLVVCGDTGVAHLASAYRTPSVVLFGPTPPSAWGPPDRPEHVVLWHGSDDAVGGDPWGDEVDPRLLDITVDEVVAAASRARAGRPAAPHDHEDLSVP
jgi:ADP-heptose:LPS heptosyltransferase